MLTFSESFKQSHQAHKDWQVDRPLIDRFNHSDITVALELLSGEIQELNGGDNAGIFSAENIRDNHEVREDYRQQEISDIVVFAMTAFDKLGIEIDFSGIEQKVLALGAAYQFDIVSAENSQFPPKALDSDQNEQYVALRERLNYEASKVVDFDIEQRGQAELILILENILSYSIAMHSLIGVSSATAVMEKIARNMIKYPASLFTLTEEESRMDDDQLRELYNARRKKGATDFDGPIMKMEVTKHDGEGTEIVEDRPKYGTTEFYSKQEIREYEPGEVRAIGLFYQAMAKAIATTWGYSVKVSNLLKK